MAQNQRHELHRRNNRRVDNGLNAMRPRPHDGHAKEQQGGRGWPHSQTNSDVEVNSGQQG